MHVHRGIHLPNDFPRPIRSQKANDVGILWPGTVDDDAIGVAQLLAATI